MNTITKLTSVRAGSINIYQEKGKLFRSIMILETMLVQPLWGMALLLRRRLRCSGVMPIKEAIMYCGTR